MQTIIEVQRRPATHEPYNYELLGAPILGYADRVHGRKEKIAAVWRDMMRRCYDTSATHYHMYGGKGVTVHKDWHQVGAFIESVMQIPNSNLKDEDWDAYSLDKDYYGSNQYGPSTCVWLDVFEQAAYTSQARPMVATGPLGQEYKFLSGAEAMRHFDVSKSTLLAHLGSPPRGNNYSKKLLGFKVQELKSEHLLRRAVLPFRHVIAIDLETSGLDPARGEILEVCAHLLTSDFEIVDTFQGVLPFDPAGFDEVITDMHTKNGLIGSKPTCTLAELQGWLAQYPRATLLGSSIKFDHAWLEHHITGVSLHHRVIDVSSLKGLVDLTDRLPETESDHRAASDIAYSLDIARLYRDVLQAGVV